MARGKIQMKRIENPVHRQVTFCKRRAGLLKKAKELSVLCDAEIGVIIFSAHGKIFEQASKGAMQGLIERYMKNNRGTQAEQVVKDKEVVDLKDEISKLKLEIDVLQKGIRFIFGGGNDSMTLDEMNVLEKHLELWMCHVRSAKMDIMFQEIQLLKNKEEILKAANEYLQYKMNEQYGIDSIAPMLTDIEYPLMTNNQFPLTIQNEIYQF
ncbi:agamous-like MADS-box protein AGL12 isoform X1 [Olea europaea var. sylvestris]|uniref:agamous-like MADS-box protein AGL12 isoform X1 n=1 Tax=Olea europaea var. sylvestris TaxID=158386 RepID=UPI000C1D23F3|nr:agamous-like MADS-box protein AGL12 isoform X1 [Olea europaea var. sylvestris]